MFLSIKFASPRCLPQYLLDRKIWALSRRCSSDHYPNWLRSVRRLRKAKRVPPLWLRQRFRTVGWVTIRTLCPSGSYVSYLSLGRTRTSWGCILGGSDSPKCQWSWSLLRDFRIFRSDTYCRRQVFQALGNHLTCPGTDSDRDVKHELLVKRLASHPLYK